MIAATVTMVQIAAAACGHQMQLPPFHPVTSRMQLRGCRAAVTHLVGHFGGLDLCQPLHHLVRGQDAHAAPVQLLAFR